jgi:hypothetical protein
VRGAVLAGTSSTLAFDILLFAYRAGYVGLVGVLKIYLGLL